MTIVLNLPRKVSAKKPPSRHKMKDVPMKSVTTLAAVELGRCMVPPKYVTKFTAIPIVDSLSIISIPVCFQVKIKILCPVSLFFNMVYSVTEIKIDPISICKS